MAVDERFYTLDDAITLEAIAELTGARLIGDGNVLARNIGAAATALEGELCYHEGDAKTAENVSKSAAACFVKEDAAIGLPEGVAALVSPLPRYDHKVAAEHLLTECRWPAGEACISSQAVIAPSAKLSPGVCVFAGATIGENTLIGPHTAIGPGVVIGSNCQIGASVTIQAALIGNHVTISSGARIGEVGFGVIAGPDGLVDAPHYGRVLLRDHVSIGANSCVDRGAFDDTILEEHVKIDNFCQIAHNVMVGSNSVMAAFAGISGSVIIGSGAQLGGRVGISDHVTIGNNVKLGASSGLFRDVPDDETWGGAPAKPFQQWMRELAWVAKQVPPRNKK